MRLASRFLVVPGWAAVQGNRVLVWQGPEEVLQGFGVAPDSALVYQPPGWTSEASLGWWDPTWWAELLSGAHLRADALGVASVLIPHARGGYPSLGEWCRPAARSGARARRIRTAALVRVLGSGSDLDPEATLRPIPDPALVPLAEVLQTLMDWIGQDQGPPLTEAG